MVYMDEQPVQLIKETRAPVPATEDGPRRVDYECQRTGTAAVFMFCDPLEGWRPATARERRTKTDWAGEVAGLLAGRYADCDKITVVLDNLNMHTKGALYAAFEPAGARELACRIEFCYTPKHGSWLNIAENELSAMTRQCPSGRRIGDLGTLQSEIAAWATDVNDRQRGVDWRMTITDARCKIKPIYSKIMLWQITRQSTKVAECTPGLPISCPTNRNHVSRFVSAMHGRLLASPSQSPTPHRAVEREDLALAI